MSALRAVADADGFRPTLADRMARREWLARAARRRELSVIEALFSDDPAASVVFVHGRAGAGKTTLLELAISSGRAAGWQPVRIDCCAVGADHTVLDEQLARADRLERPLVVLDGYEAIAALGPRLRDELLPVLPELAIVLIAGCEAPEPAWREGLWRIVTVELALGPRSETPATGRPRTATPARGAAADRAAVRDALRNLGVPVELAASPLASGTTMAERAESVRELLRDAARQAFGETHDERLLRQVLERGYLDPAHSHELAADELHLSRSAYFRRLRQASDRLARWLVPDAA